MTRGAGRRLALAGVLWMLAGVLAPSVASAAGTNPLPVGLVGNTPSAVTVNGTGSFAGLRVTVGQTRDLVDQDVELSWTGGKPTVPEVGGFGTDYLQVMQCWGGASGPERQNCEFGGQAAFDTRGGDNAASRQLNYPFVDPLETTKLPAGRTTYLPFVAVNGVTASPGNTNQFFDSSTTNEVPFARTGPDGTGDTYVELLTGREAPGLGCGQLVAGHPRGCWLVIVPRGSTEVDGTPRSGTGSGTSNVLSSSPLSASNWKNHLQVPLQFQPVGNTCPLGAKERQTLGVEPVVEAMTRWQPELCAGGAAVFNLSEVSAAVTNAQLVSADPALAFVAGALPSSSVDPAHPIVYAPIALSGIGIGIAIDSQAPPTAPESVRRNEGKPIADVNLTPRLVAKLLTQSYQTGVPAGARYLTDNPRDLTRDPDFLAVNPGFAPLQFDRVADIVTPLGSSAANRQLWQWVESDASARAFLAGYPDKWGMRVNPFYQGLTAADDFPKLDPYCEQFGKPIAGFFAQTPLCTLDEFPYAGDMHEGTRGISRGDRLAHDLWNLATTGGDTPPGYGKAPAQLTGRRSLLAVTDTATATRYGLALAHLQTASGTFVAPTQASLSAGLAAMKLNTATGISTLDPATKVKGAYPLTTVTYAATAPNRLSKAEAKDYAGLVRYAVGAGQQPGTAVGQLPFGYIPLPAALTARALSAADDIAARRGPSPVTLGAVPPGPAVAATAAADARAAQATAAGLHAQPVSAITPRGVTPGLAIGAVRYSVIAALVLGGAAVLFAPALPWILRLRSHLRSS